MARLTQWDEYGNADIITLSDTMPEIYAELSFSEANALTDALNRLGAYEDSGLEPQEASRLREENEHIRQTHYSEEFVSGLLKELGEYQALGTIDRLRELAAAQLCASENCPHQTGETCPAADGCGGFVESDQTEKGDSEE